MDAFPHLAGVMSHLGEVMKFLKMVAIALLVTCVAVPAGSGFFVADAIAKPDKKEHKKKEMTPEQKKAKEEAKKACAAMKEKSKSDFHKCMKEKMPAAAAKK
jgi:hypothetical protein